MWKQEGCIKRERSQWESREGQCGEGATQVLTLSGVQRLVVFADSLSQPCHCSSSVACTCGCPTPPVLVRYHVPSAALGNPTKPVFQLTQRHTVSDLRSCFLFKLPYFSDYKSLGVSVKKCAIKEKKTYISRIFLEN